MFAHRMSLATVCALTLLTIGCVSNSDATESASQTADPAVEQEGLASAIFAGGCFWCMEEPFDVLDGVASTTSGYIGGHVENPTYEAVTTGRTGHTEAVEIRYDPAKVTYAELLEVFWHNIDPTVENRQFCDRGSQYRSGIFYLDAEQKAQAEASRDAILAAGTVDRIVTEITEATAFYDAEDYHQDFYEKSPVRYKTYRLGCGRDRRLKEIWGDDAGH